MAAILTALGGGFLASTLEPASALHTAATITILAPIAVMTASYFIVREQPTELSFEQARETTRSMIVALKSPEIRIAAVFLVLWCFSPGFGTPMYFHMTDRLKFDQQFIGQLNALMAFGAVLGALIFARYLSKHPPHVRATIAIVAAVSGILAYMSLAQPSAQSATLAIPLNTYVGMVNQIGALSVFALAAACPPRAAGFTFALMMSLYNGVEQLSSVIGARLYSNVFEQSLEPLLWVAAASLLCCLALVPSLKRINA